MQNENMNTSDLYSKIKELLPVKQGDTDFQETLQKALSDYTSDVQQLDSSVFSNDEEKAETISKIENINVSITRWRN